MKLKYYLRGLGIGILVVALILTVSGNTDAKMSDEAVKRRAAELGMVEKDKSVLGDIGSETAAGEDTLPENGTPEASKPEESAPGQTPEPEESVSGQTAEPEETGEEAPEPENGMVKPEAPAEAAGGTPGTEENEAGQTEAVSSAEDAAGQEPVQEIEERAGEVADRAEDVAENSPAGRVVTLEVRRGDSSVSVARRAAEAGLVQSAADFDVFLCRNGYDKRISVGNYEITEGASEKEIADIITKSR